MMRVARSFVCVTLVASVAVSFIVLLSAYAPSFTYVVSPARSLSTARPYRPRGRAVASPTTPANGSSLRSVPGPARRKVLILTTRRSGSSFVGELLNQHPGFYYIFEPLKLFGDQNADNRTVAASTRFLSRLFRCQLRLAVEEASVRYGAGKPPLALVLGSTFERHTNGERQTRLTTSLRHEEVRCARRRRHVAIKVIRIHGRQLAVVSQLVRRDSVHVLHLVRDPRGVISSRAKIDQIRTGLDPAEYVGQYRDTLLEAAANHCRRVLTCLHTMARHRRTQPGFARLYDVVRYEDFAYRPLPTAARLYASLGVPMHARVVRWLHNATQRKPPSGTKAGRLSYSYSTNRNSRNTAEAWRHHLPFSLVDAIQRIADCAQLTRQFGYLPATSEAALYDLATSLVSNIPRQETDAASHPSTTAERQRFTTPARPTLAQR